VSLRELIISRAFVAILMVSITSLTVYSQGKQLAVTMDDLPLNGPDIGLPRLREMTEKILAAFQKHKVPVVGFVNESQLYVPHETDERIAILGLWPKAGVELGNHTFTHLGFKDAQLAQYEDNFIADETVTKMLMKPYSGQPRYFRHPFLQMGSTREIEEAFEAFIGARGYKIAPITASSEDWMFLAAYEDARTKNDREAMASVSDDYLKYTEGNFEASEKKSEGLFGRQIKQILLLHANELNAEGNLDRLFTMLEKRGYTFITLGDALSDPAYKLPEKYTPTSDWFALWASSGGKSFVGPTPPDYIQKAYADAQKK